MSWNLTTGFDLSDPALVAALDELPLWSAPFGLALLDTIAMRKDLRVLDVGPGLGFPGIEIAQRLGATSRVVGLDPWRAALARARAKIRQWEVGNAHLVEGRAEVLPFADGTFDLIVSNNGTNNVDDEERAFAEIGRVARPGAQLVLTMNLPGTMREFYEVFERVLTARGIADARERIAAHVFAKRKPVAHVRALLARAGFAVAGTTEDTFTLRFVDGAALLAHSLIRVGFLGSWAALVPPEDAPGVFAAVREELDRTAGAAGGLSLSVPWACFDARRAGG